jgi:D-alanine-D-alanine ligase-like ATP-grasp enzyme
MRICVLHSGTVGSTAPYAPFDPDRDPSPWLVGHDVHHATLEKATAIRQIRELVTSGFDVFINLCDGAWEEDRPGIEVVTALERLGAAFTGADSRFYEPSRERMKRVCRYYDIPTPEGAFIRPGDALAELDELRPPLIVKHANSYNSIGLTPASRVADVTAATLQVHRMLDLYHQALVEEFIEGDEVTVLVSENADDPGAPHTYVPMRCSFPPGETFKHFDLKWKDHLDIAWYPVADGPLSTRLRELSARMFVALGGRGYGRCDIRIDRDGTPWFLEMNPNCGVFYPPATPGSADVILAADPVGHAGFLRRILAAAIATRDRTRPMAEVRWRRDFGHDVIASHSIPRNSVIFSHEERKQALVSRRRAETWTGRQKAWFAAYCWPIGDDVFGMWSEDADEWTPINHSCDPNAWMDGLDVVARRAIRKGEPITLDYATFAGLEMAEFECRCGTALCRGVVRGSDLRLADLTERYRDHLSPWVEAQLRRGP